MTVTVELKYSFHNDAPEQACVDAIADSLDDLYSAEITILESTNDFKHSGPELFTHDKRYGVECIQKAMLDFSEPAAITKESETV